MATQIGLPISTYLTQNVQLPDFLDYWPRLKRPQDIKTYVESKIEVLMERTQFSKDYRFDSQKILDRQRDIDEFYSVLKKKL